MFVPRIGQRLFLAALALGLILFPSVTWATTVIIPHPFLSDPTLATPPQPAWPGTLPSLSKTNTISISNNGAAAPTTVYFGTLDLQNNDIIFSPTTQNATNGLALYNAVNDMARSGSNGGGQDGTGIMSSFAKIDTLHGNGALGVGVLYNQDGGGGVFYGGGSPDVSPTYDGYTGVQAFDTIVKYTFLGDTFLRGFIDTFDTSGVQNNSDLGVTPTVNTWFNGDFFYQATSGSPINTFDTSAVFNGQVLQSQYPKTVSFGQGGAAAGSVPEPSSIVLLLLASVGSIAAGLRFRKPS
jgi:hypothetical protein